MAREIERKFLVVSNQYRAEAYTSTKMIQGYLSTVPERVVRIRVRGNQGFITIKGTADESGVSRFEWEKEIPETDAHDLLEICEPGVIEKTRYKIKSGIHTFEVDEFHGENQGLIIAEVELSAENEAFGKPEWLGEEVTGNPKYYNSVLSKNSFKNWQKTDQSIRIP
jgi:adenylate cyclase